MAEWGRFARRKALTSHSEFRNNLLSRRTREGGAWGLAAPLDSRVSYLAPPLSFNRNGEPRFELFT